MEEIKYEINNIITEIEKIAECLYQQRIQEGYVLLNSGLDHIMNLINKLYTLKMENKISFEETTMLDNLRNAMTAMESNDYVLLADILVYEVLEQLKNI